MGPRMSCSAGRPPALSNAAVANLVKHYYRFETVDKQSVKQFPSYDDRNFYFRGIPEVQPHEPLHIPTHPDFSAVRAVANQHRAEGEYVLKLNNPLFASFDVLKGINALLNHLHSNGCTKCIRPILSREKNDVLDITREKLLEFDSDLDVPEGEAESKFYMRVVTFIPGECLDEIDKHHLTPRLLYDVGYCIGNANAIMQSSFRNVSLEGRTLLNWDLTHFLTLRTLLPLHENDKEREMAKLVFDAFETHVSPKMSLFKKGIIYGDANGLNIIVRKDSSGDYQMVGMIDFGDCLSSYYIFDLGILLAYIMLENLNVGTSPIAFVGPVLRGYTDAFPLSSEEIESLYYITMARCCQSALNGTNSFKHEPWNTYLLITPAKCWKLIELMLNTSKEEVDKIWAKTLIPLDN